MAKTKKQTSQKRPSGLILVYPIPADRTETSCDFVIIPTVWHEKLPGRTKDRCSWAKPLRESTAADVVRVFIFHYQLDLDGSSLWDQLLNQNLTLLSSLDEQRSLPNGHLRPLLFICHGLGGLILKRALTDYKKSSENCRMATCGIIFLGTPHLISEKTEGWGMIRSLMKAKQKGIARENLDESAMNDIMAVCMRFQQLHLNIPILSVYEMRETVDKLRRWRKKNDTETRLTQKMVQIDINGETLVGVDKSHAELCESEESEPLYGKLVEYFSDFVATGHSTVNVSVRPALSMNSLQRCSSIETSWDSYAGSIYTPETGSSAQSSRSKEMDVEADMEKVRLPFLHTGSIARNKQFYARGDELRDIDAAFGLLAAPDEDDEEDSRPVPKTYALCGMGGMGKTETAMEYLYSRRGEFGAVIWIHADTERKLGAQFVELAKELDPAAVADRIDETSARSILWSWLARPVGYRTVHGSEERTETNWLMVFDNADNPDVLHEWLPSQGPGCILVTSRYPFVEEGAFWLQQGRTLEPLPAAVGGKLLCELSGRTGDPAATASSERISEALGGLPLAIFQTSSIIRTHQLTLGDFEAWYGDEPQWLHDFRASGPPTAYQHSLGTAWATDKLRPAAAALLRVMAVLDPDQISEKVLKDGAHKVAMACYPVQPSDYFQARAELLHTSLVSRNMATNELRTHRLVQDVVRCRMTARELQHTFMAAAVLLADVWPFVSGTDPTRNQAWRIHEADRYSPHICRLEALFGADIRAGLFDASATSGYLFCSYAWYMFERGLPTQTVQYSSLAQSILGQALARTVARDTQDELDTQRWLGEAHHNLSLAACQIGSSDSIADAETWTDLLQQLIAKYGHASDRLALATALNQKGICLANAGRLEHAKTSFQESIAAYRNVPEAPRFSGTFPAISLSLVHVLQQQPDRAELVLRSALEDHEQILGSSDKTTTESGHIWRSMGHIRNAQHRFPEALHYHEKAVANFLVTLGDKHYYTGDAFYSLAHDLLRKGDDQRGMECLEKAIIAFTAGEHRDAQAARAMWRKGCLLQKMRNEHAARAVLQEAMGIRQKLLDQPDPRPVESLVDEDWTRLILYWSR